jgi:hypothetical protein
MYLKFKKKSSKALTQVVKNVNGKILGKWEILNNIMGGYGY